MLLACVVCCASTSAQIRTVTFTGRDRTNQHHIPLSRVNVFNLDQLWEEILYYPDTVLILGTVGIDDYDSRQNVQLMQNVPNPFDGTTEFALQLPDGGDVFLEIYDITGKLAVAERFTALPVGTHLFQATLSSPQTYLLSAKVDNGKMTIKMVNEGHGAGNTIHHLGMTDKNGDFTLYLKNEKASSSYPFHVGDEMQYEGFALLDGTLWESAVVTQPQMHNDTVPLLFDVTVPTVLTSPVADITANTVVCGGNVTADGNAPVTARGVCWDTLPNPTVDDSFTADSTGVGSFTSHLSGLTDGTTYYVRAYATNSVGTAYGEEREFSTLLMLSPTVTTNTVTDVTVSSATCGGVVTSDGNVPVTARGVCWDTLPNPTVDDNDSLTFNGSGIGSFTSMLSGLAEGTTYYVRAYAINSVDTAYGEQKSFTTQILPSVITDSVSNITTTSAECGGKVVSQGSSAVIYRGVCWSISQNPTVDDSHTTENGGVGSFTSSITGLYAGVRYYVRAYATSSAGTAYGAQVTFVTTFTCGSNTVSDHEGNAYHTVQIGNQCWTKDNLRTTTSPSTGTYLIPSASTGSTYTGKQARWYNNDSTTYAPMNYGLLYNWNAAVDTFNTAYGETSVNTSSNNAVSVTFSGHRRGICPAGWHLPSDAEWTQLTDYVSSQSEYTCSGNSSYIAKALASTEGWNTSTNSCAVGNNQGSNNATGFSAVPAGICGGSSFNGVGGYAYFWSSTQFNSYSAWNRTLYYRNAAVIRNDYYKASGFSVRCLRDVEATIPTVTTNAVSNIMGSSALCGGNVTDAGGAVVTARGVCWDTLPNPTVDDSFTVDSIGVGSFTSYLSGLADGTTYYVRAYATNGVGTAYGEQRTFTTLSLPLVETDTVSNITGSTAVCGGNVISEGDAPVTARGVCWSTSIDPTVDGQHTTIYGSGTGSFNSNLSGLTAGTTYYVRAYATSSLGTAYGEQRTFTTAFTCGNVVADYDGNSYNTVQIGNQCWMKENLRTAHLNNGVSIQLVQDSTSWGYSSSPAYCYYNQSTYGCLYNYYAVEGGQLCPPGWHVPTYNEVHTILHLTLGGSDAGGEMKTTGTTYWLSPNTGATNSSGYSARGSGIRYPGHSISGIKERAVYWTSNTYNDDYAYDFYLCYDQSYLQLYGVSAYDYSIWKRDALSVRCLRDDEINEVSNPCPGLPTVTDYDGNVYHTVQIGGQCWMKENLRTTRYADGTEIALAASNTDSSSTVAYRYNPGNHSFNVSTYGYLYNWPAVMNGEASSSSLPSNVQGICPMGWHVPSDAEWTQLTNYVSCQSEYVCNNNSGYIAKALASNTGWAYVTNNTCAVGFDLSSNNATGFSALPSGRYDGNQCYYASGSFASFWSATETNSSYAYYRTLTYAIPDVLHYDDNKSDAYSVRCLRDGGGNPPNAPTGVTATLSGSQIQVSWNSVSNATSYKVYRSSSANGSYTLIGSPTNIYYYDTNPLTGYNYYKVKAVNSAGESAFSSVASCNYVTAPTAPTGVAATLSGSQIQVSWNSVSNATSYKVYRSSSANGSYTLIGSPTNIYYYDTNPLTGYNYYKVKAVNSAGESVFSSVASCNYSGSTDGQPCSGTPTVTDVDNNVYNTVQIGQQCWMKENLRTTRYANGTSIPLGGGTYGTTTAYRYYPNNISSNVSTYGYLYNWTAVMGNSSSSSTNPSGVQGICPTGWHVPSDEEWTQLTDYVSSQSQYLCGNDTTYIAKALAATTGWNTSTDTCAVGNDQSSNNATGFSALPAGQYSGDYSNFNNKAYFWSSTESDIWPWHYSLSSYSTNMNRNNDYYTLRSFSVRCLRDELSPVSSLPYSTNFYDDDTWTLNNGTCSNYWTKNPTYGLFVTNDDTTPGYSITQASTVMAEKLLLMPSSDSIHIEFDVRVGGENGYDYLKVFLAPSSVTYTAGTSHNTQSSTSYSTYAVDFSNFKSQTQYSSNPYTFNLTNGNTIHVSVNVANPNANDTAKLVFLWRDDTSMGTQPGAVISQLSVSEAVHSSTAVIDSKSCPAAPTVTDHEGNVYATVQIGNQCWMRDNLRTTTSPSTGTYLIPASSTGYTYTGKQARWYNNDSATYAPMNYGLLYNWNAAVDTFNTAYGETSVNTSSNNAVSVTFSGHRRGICPAGWHLPSDAEWTQLTDYVSGIDEYLCGSTVYYIAKALASTTSWSSNTSACAVGNTPESNNKTGFSALPSGGFDGSIFDSFGTNASFWSSTENGWLDAYYRALGCDASFVYRDDDDKSISNCSVRCLRDEMSSATVIDSKSCPATPTVTDHEGNVYATVQIGDQCWMRENLRTTTSPSTGTYIVNSEFTSGTDMAYTYTGKMARWYNNDSTTYAPMNYGLLYNWNAAVDTFNTAYGETSVDTDLDNLVSASFTGNRRGICPAGWHLPSDAEWTTLTNYVRGQSQYVCSSDNANIAKALASTTGWGFSTNTCAIGNDWNSNNETGFSAFPAGCFYGSSSSFGNSALFWSSSQDESYSYVAYLRSLPYNSAVIVRREDLKNLGFSVRCLRD